MFVLNEVGRISEIEQTLTCIKKMTRIRINTVELHERATNTEVLYYKGDGSLTRTEETNAGVKLVTLKDLFAYNNREKLYLYFRRVNQDSTNADDTYSWSGTYIGTLEYLTPYITQTIKSNHNNRQRTNEFITSKSLEVIYELLFDKEHWKSSDEKSPFGRLRNYLKYTLEFSTKFLKEKSDVIFNADNTKLVFNSRLFCVYGYYVVLIADVNKRGNASNCTVLDSSVNLAELGFNSEARPETVDIAETMKDCVFKASFDEFDFQNIGRLRHIIRDRLFRFQTGGKPISDLDLMFIIRNSVSVAIQLSLTNPNYVHPMYSAEYKEIQYLIPIHLDYSSLSKPTCALAVRKSENNLWSLQTVLDIQNAYVNSRVIKRPDELWLSLEGEV